jgi:adenosylcobinamide kinase/adenosylcobinamide-phosphate guanylyltransferase
MTFPKLSLVLGGAASGKSLFAERFVTFSARPRVYVATSQVFDDEMKTKVAAHLTQRGTGWTTHEAHFDLAPALKSCSPEDIILVDCATMWLSNHMLIENDIPAETDALLSALSSAPCPVVIVSNETGQGIVPENKLARSFRDAQGKLNQTLAAKADLVTYVVAGLPMVVKGSLPEGFA